MPSPDIPEHSAVETWKAITGMTYEAAALRREAYDAWFHICWCGHDHGRGDDFTLDCPVEGCRCEGYDHIAGKPDHPLSPLPASDPRAPALRKQGAEEAEEKLRALRAHLSDASVALRGQVIDGKELAHDVSLAEAIRLILAERDQALANGAEERAQVQAVIEAARRWYHEEFAALPSYPVDDAARRLGEALAALEGDDA